MWDINFTYLLWSASPCRMISYIDTYLIRSLRSNKLKIKFINRNLLIYQSYWCAQGSVCTVHANKIYAWTHEIQYAQTIMQFNYSNCFALPRTKYFYIFFRVCRIMNHIVHRLVILLARNIANSSHHISFHLMICFVFDHQTSGRCYLLNF